MAAEDDATAELLARLWELVEEWSSGAIQRARAAGSGMTDVADAEVRLLVEHAAELRGVVEAHLERADVAAGSTALQPAPPEREAPESEAVGTEATAEPETTTTPPHTCNSADFDRPTCTACGGQHWYCSICGTRRDDCPAA